MAKKFSVALKDILFEEELGQEHDSVETTPRAW
jgi:hypothetical protein